MGVLKERPLKFLSLFSNIMIECFTLFGMKKLVPKAKLVFRPAAYAIIVKDQEILLLKTKTTGKYWFPGGGIEIGERMETGLKREIQEETGISIEIQKLLDFKEIFFYYEPLDEAYHNFSFFFICKPLSFDIVRDEDVDDGESEKPRWIEISSLLPDDFQIPAGEIFQIFRKCCHL